MTELLTPDICIIGAGSGGLTVAAAAAAFGVNVVLIEKNKMGGDCLNYGCVPSKALIAAAKHADGMRHGARFGISDVEPEIDFRKINRHIQSVISAIEPNDSVERFTALGVHVIEEEARFEDRRTVVAGDYRIKARRFVVATGSSPLVPPIPGLDDVSFLTNETIFDQTRKPDHLVIIGGGPIGMELAQAYRRLGSEVTVLEAAKALGQDDSELVRIVLDKLRAEGVVVREQAKVTEIEPRGENGFSAHIETEDGPEQIEGSHLLVAAGRAANVSGLGLEKAGIRHDRSGIKVDDSLRTTNMRVYAIGDVAGGLQFTHVAGYHAGLVVRSILFRLRARKSTHMIPWVTFTDPALAHVGLNHEEAAKIYGKINVLRWPYAENDRAQTEYRTSGMIKIITDKGGRIVGVSIVGAGADEMIGFWALAISKSMKVRDIADYVAPYPTFGEIGKRAAITYYSDMPRKPFVRWLVRILRKFG